MKHRTRIERLERRLTSPEPVESLGFFVVTEVSGPGRLVQGDTSTGQNDLPGHGKTFTPDELDAFMDLHSEFTGVFKWSPVVAAPDGRPEGPWQKQEREAKEKEANDAQNK